ncbi:hypothetical protein PLICRDRAFT_457048 [Plicaturopsis crispa FD-325 SS-3]|nr:hypothetical protein PLICRDRAFT_457048 [Plicaturopsis crispa FD-325 SS-3]
MRANSAGPFYALLAHCIASVRTCTLIEFHPLSDTIMPMCAPREPTRRTASTDFPERAAHACASRGDRLCGRPLLALPASGALRPLHVLFCEASSASPPTFAYRATIFSRSTRVHSIDGSISLLLVMKPCTNGLGHIVQRVLRVLAGDRLHPLVPSQIFL